MSESVADGPVRSDARSAWSLRPGLPITCEYTIRACLRLAQEEPGVLTPIKQIAADLCVPYPSLARTMSILAREGVLLSERGRTGGVGLAYSPREMSLLDVLTATHEACGDHRCILGLQDCTEATPCPADRQLSKAHSRGMLFLQTWTLARFAAAMKRR